jgi:hypothetical protein
LHIRQRFYNIVNIDLVVPPMPTGNMAARLMSNEQGRRDGRAQQDGVDELAEPGGARYRDEVFSKRVPAGKRTYFFDVKSTRSGEDYFVTITESKRVDEGRYEKHKIFLYKEDFGKFILALHQVIEHIRDERLQGYEFEDLPDLVVDAPEDAEAFVQAPHY